MILKMLSITESKKKTFVIAVTNVIRQVELDFPRSCWFFQLAPKLTERIYRWKNLFAKRDFWRWESVEDRVFRFLSIRL